jgi:hypothetical protein
MATQLLAPQVRLANEAIAQEHDAGILIVLVAIGLVLANVFIWAMVASGS